MNLYNANDEIVCLTPKTICVLVRAVEIEVKNLGREQYKVHHVKVADELSTEEFGKKLKEQMELLFPGVGDLSSHLHGRRSWMMWCEV